MTVAAVVEMFVFGCFIIVSVIRSTSAAACSGGWTTVNDNAKTYITSDEQNLNRLFFARNNDYKVTCTCGTISSWKVYARRAGTLFVFVAGLDSGSYVVRNVNKITIPALSGDNFFEVPIAEGYRISTMENDYIGWFSTTTEMITYNVDAAAGDVYYKTAASVAKGDTFTVSSSFSNRRFAISAYVYQNRPPMFLNAPASITLYTDNTGTDVTTLSVFDHDPDDVASPLTVTSALATGFTYASGTKKLTYTTAQGEGTHVNTFVLSDGCESVTAAVTVVLVNRESLFTNLPSWTSLAEGTVSSNFVTITTSDSGDTVTCLIDSQTASAISISSNSLSYNGSPFNTNKWHEVIVTCNDGTNTVYSSYGVDITKNTKPVFTNLPGSVVVSPSGSSVIFTVAATDTDSLTYAITTASTPFTMNPTTGAITPTPTLTLGGYDLTITATDGTNTVSSTLSVLNSGAPRQNAAPVITNLGATWYVMENTAADTYLFTVGYKDADQSNTLTLTHTFSDADMSSYFDVDDATGIVKVKVATIDYETLPFSKTNGKIRFTVSDETDTNLRRLTIVTVNVNENPSFGSATYTASVNEGAADSTFSDPSITTTDIDGSFTHTVKMSCSTNSKDFYITSTNQIKLARSWDADVTGITNSATCTLTVTDEGGLTATASLTLTITNINDHDPKFQYDSFTFIVSASSFFFTTIGIISATDDDSDTFGTTNGVVTYSFLDNGGTYFMADETGTLFVRDVSSFSTGAYTTFRFVATDAGSSTGTCTVTIIFSDVQATTTTTTERTYTMLEDAGNYTWMLIVGVIVLGCFIATVIILKRDPALRETLVEWNRRRKVKEPKLDKATREMRHYLKEKRAKNEEKKRKKEEKKRKKDPSYGLPWELLATKTTADVIEEEDEDNDGKTKKEKKKEKKAEEKRKKEEKKEEEKMRKEEEKKIKEEEKRRKEDKKRKGERRGSQTHLIVQAYVEATPHSQLQQQHVPGEVDEENMDDELANIHAEDTNPRNRTAAMFGTSNVVSQREELPKASKDDGAMDF